MLGGVQLVDFELREARVVRVVRPVEVVLWTLRTDGAEEDERRDMFLTVYRS